MSVPSTVPGLEELMKSIIKILFHAAVVCHLINHIYELQTMNRGTKGDLPIPSSGIQRDSNPRFFSYSVEMFYLLSLEGVRCRPTASSIYRNSFH